MSDAVAPYPHRWRTFWICAAVAAMTILDLSKVNVALPSIREVLGGGSTEIQLIVSGFVLAFGLLLVPMGRLGDQVSPKRLFLIGLVLYAATSALCALAPTPEALIVGRIAQGVAAGIQMPQVMGTLQRVFTGRERGMAFGLLGATIGLGTALGPVIGGLFVQLGDGHDGWRGIFWMNVPLALVIAAIVVWALPDLRPQQRGRISLDPVGVALFAIAVLALMVPFLFTTGEPTDDPRRWWSLAVFVPALAGFVAWEARYQARGNAPLVPPGLLRIPSFRNGSLLMTAYFAGMPAIFLTTTLYLQTGLGIGALAAGATTMGFALASAASSVIGGRLVGRIGRPLVVTGLVLVMASVAGLGLVAAFAPAGAVTWLMAGVMTLGGLGGGIVISPNQTLTLADIPPHEGGLAGSVGQLVQRIGTAVGTAVTLSLFYATVFGESGGEAQPVVYRDAYLHGLLAVGACLALALVFALMDLRSRRRAR
ncbi:MFS transporter [Microbacterium sediminis]|nr:MFS transporter [Microbacterium sediminis]